MQGTVDQPQIKSKPEHLMNTKTTTNKQNKNKTKINSKPRQNGKTATIKTTPKQNLIRFFDSASVIVNRILTTFALNMSGYLVSA